VLVGGKEGVIQTKGRGKSRKLSRGPELIKISRDSRMAERRRRVDESCRLGK